MLFHSAPFSARLLILLRVRFHRISLNFVGRKTRSQDELVPAKTALACLLYQGDNGSSLYPFLFDVPSSASFRPIIHEQQPCHYLGVRPRAYLLCLDVENERKYREHQGSVKGVTTLSILLAVRVPLFFSLDHF